MLFKTFSKSFLFVLAALFAPYCLQLPAAFADSLAPPYSADYTLTDLGSVPGLATPYGGLTLEAGSPNDLLIGGSAETDGGVIDEIQVTRDSNNHITGFTGTTTLLSTAPHIDGGLVYAPSGVLLFTAYPNNTLGEIKPGSTSPDKTVNLTAAGVGASVGGVNFVPAGYAGAGELKITSYSTGGFYGAALTPDGSGTYDVTSATLKSTPGGGPEGFAYVPLGSADFAAQSLLLAQFNGSDVAACPLDGDGNPITASCNPFITGLTGAEGAFVDPLTGDFLFSTYSTSAGGNHLLRVSGFAAPAVPEGSQWVMLALTAFVAFAAIAIRKKRLTVAFEA